VRGEGGDLDLEGRWGDGERVFETLNFMITKLFISWRLEIERNVEPGI
jgi:hypothetical protein